MNIKFYKASSLLIPTGIILIISGLAVSYINARSGVLSYMLLSIGFVLCAAAVFFNRRSIKKWILNIRILSCTRTFLTLLISLVLLIGANCLASRFDILWDLTSAKQHTLSQTTKDLLKGLQHNAQITILYVGPAPKYIEDLAAEYTRLSNGKIKVQTIDPMVDLGRAAELEKVITSKTKLAIVESHGERQDIDFTGSKLTEEFLTNAIIKTTRDKRRVYFVDGHEEYDIEDTSSEGFNIFNKVLENNNCLTSKIMLGITERVPKDCDVLVIAGPKTQYTEIEAKIIQEYLKNGGRALFFIESTPMSTEENPLTEQDKLKNPNMNEILNYWGVKIGDDVVVDLENHVGKDVGSPATRNYPPHDKIVTGLDYTFYVRPRSISKTEPGEPDIKVAPLVYTESSENSWAEKDRTLKVKFDEGVDIKGPVSIAAIVWGPKNEERKDDTKMIIFTDADFVSNAFITQYSNANIALNSIGWLTELENVMPIKEQKEGEDVERFDLTSKQIRIVTVILVAIPLLIALCGIILWSNQINK